MAPSVRGCTFHTIQERICLRPFWAAETRRTSPLPIIVTKYRPRPNYRRERFVPVHDLRNVSKCLLGPDALRLVTKRHDSVSVPPQGGCMVTRK